MEESESIPSETMVGKVLGLVLRLLRWRATELSQKSQQHATSSKVPSSPHVVQRTVFNVP